MPTLVPPPGDKPSAPVPTPTQPVPLTQETTLTQDEYDLLNAAETGHVDKVYELIWKGTSVSCRKILSGTCPLALAARAGHAKVVGILLDAGASVEETDFYGATALHWASNSGHNDIIEMLMHPRPSRLRRASVKADGEAGGEARGGSREETNLGGPRTSSSGPSLPDLRPLSVQDRYGSTALHFAAVQNADKTVFKLVSAGSDCTIRNNDGRRPQDLTTSDALKVFLADEETKHAKLASAASRGGGSAGKRKGTKTTKTKRPVSANPLVAKSKTPGSTNLFAKRPETSRPLTARPVSSTGKKSVGKSSESVSEAKGKKAKKGSMQKGSVKKVAIGMAERHAVPEPTLPGNVPRSADAPIKQ